MKPLAFGIDLGTTHTLAAYFDGNQAKLVNPNDPLIPSVVAYEKDGSVKVGREAQAMAKTNPGRVVSSVKRFMGVEAKDKVQDVDSLSYRVEPHQGLWHVKIEDQMVSPIEISAQILAKTVAQIEQECGTRPERVVITVPAYFNDKQRLATKQAAESLGLKVSRMVNEPTAAALAYGLNKLTEGNIAVYDLGGGTFDFTLMQVVDGVFRVLSTRGNTLLGGDDFDEAMMMASLHKWNLSLEQLSAEEKADLRHRVKDLRESLSDQTSADLEVVLQGKFQEMTWTREAFEEAISPLVEKTMKACRKALKDAKKKSSEVDQVVLVGGSTRTPLVRNEVAKFFAMEPLCDLNPDHVVAMGAAVQAGLIDHLTKDMLLMDVTPLSIGLETVGGAVSKLIMRNTPIPTAVTETYTTYMDGQTAIDFHVVQGERELVDDNISLAKFKLRNIPPMPASLPIVEVRFELDTDGILTVRAEEKRSGSTAAVEVIPGHGLNLDEVRDRVKDSIEHAHEDIEHIRLITARTKAQTLLMATKRALSQGLDIEKDRMERIQKSLAELEVVVQGKDVAQIDRASENLNEHTHDLADQLLSYALAEEMRGKNVSQI